MIRLKKVVLVLLAVGLACFPKKAHAFNLINDIKTNVQWKFGQAAQAGEGYDFTSDKWDSSALAEIAEYRFLSFSYGATFLDSSSSKATDTFKMGVLSSFFFNWFVNKPTPEMAWMQNLNIGPSFAVPVFSGGTGHKGVFLLDCNYKFGS